MNNEKFTQGEWEICYFRETPFGLEHYLVHEPNYGEVAVVNFHGESDGETEKANAALIAAAPQLYKMLKLACYEFEIMANYCEENNMEGDAQSYTNLAFYIHKVLKKARGEE